MRRVGHDSDSGGVAIIVAIVLSLFLLGLGALVVDVGAVYLEKRELQNGADASALAIAQACALNEPDCETQPAAATYAETNFANLNARDLDTDVVCVMDGDAPVPSTQTWSDIESMPCPWLTSNSVRVFVRTGDASGNVVSHWLAPLLSSDGSLDSTATGAMARVAWGGVSSAATIPWVISYCDYDAALDAQGGELLPPPFPAGQGPVITFHDASHDPDDTCTPLPGFDTDGDDELRGGFGKLGVDDNCQIQTYTDEDDDVWAPGQSGASAPTSHRCLEVGQTVMIPIFVDFNKSTREYRIGGYAAYHVTGYRITGGYQDNAPCGGSVSCIAGWFTTMVVSDGEIGDGDFDFGVTVIKMTD